MKKVFYFLSLILALSACGQSSEEKAKAALREAETALEEVQRDYENAQKKDEAIDAFYERFYNQATILQQQYERDKFLKELLTDFPESAQFINDTTISFVELGGTIAKVRAFLAGKTQEKAIKVYEAQRKRNEIYFQNTPLEEIK